MKVKPSDIKLKLKEKCSFCKGKGINIIMFGFYPSKRKCPVCLGTGKKDIHLRIAELLNILEKPIDISVPLALRYRKLAYRTGFRDGEEAQRKKTREGFLGK